MAVTVGDYLRPARSLASSSIPTLTLLEASGQTFGVGELVCTSGGKIKLCDTTSNLLSSSTSLVFGVTCTTGKAITSISTVALMGDTGSTQLVPAVPWMVWQAPVTYTGTTASAIIAAANIGMYYMLYRSATTKVWSVSLAKTSNKQACVIGFRDATGTRNGHVYFVFHQSARHETWK